MYFTHGKYSFKPGKLVTLLTVGLCACFLWLSNWQYQKSIAKTLVENEQKKILNQLQPNPAETRDNSIRPSRFKLQTILNLWYRYSDEFGEKLEKNSLAALNDLPIEVMGQNLLPVTFFHDNRVHNSTVGYHLLKILPIYNHKYNGVLINFGWSPLPNNRRNQLPNINIQFLPKIPAQKAALESHQPHLNMNHNLNLNLNIKGTIEIPIPNKGLFSLQTSENMEPFNLNPNSNPNKELNKDQTPAWRLQKIDIKQIQSMMESSELTSLNLAPFVIRAIQTDPNIKSSPKLIRDWSPVLSRGISAEKHRGYALQWLIFAIVLVALYISLNIRVRDSAQ